MLHKHTLYNLQEKRYFKTDQLDQLGQSSVPFLHQKPAPLLR
uniref:Uncharacterized protein n=1 Tax=Setaria italica TaxID=4555 RepID=K4ANP6_SETIT